MPMKTSGNLWFSDVFPGVLKETSAMKWVKDIFEICQQNVDIHACSITTEHVFLWSICTGSFNTLKVWFPLGDAFLEIEIKTVATFIPRR